jgi:MOSC domain-containing protein YiiM
MSQPRVVAVNASGEYSFSKPNRESITLLAGLGVEGDIHAGVTVRHRSRVQRDPDQPNLRQVHLMHTELHEELRGKGYAVESGQLGENVTTAGLDLLRLPTGTLLRLGDQAVVEVTGLRNPCLQIENFSPGILGEVVGRDEDGEIIRRAGIMSVVVTGGVVRPGDPVTVTLPAEPYRRLEPV